MEKRELTLEEVKAGIQAITDADPEFTYPQQGDDERCGCVEVEDEEYSCPVYDPSECDWHMDEDNTCRYVHEDGSPSCVIGHYYSKSLGMPTEFIAGFEAKSPLHILEKYGLTASAEANTFLNEVQAGQDDGWAWDEAYDRAEMATNKFIKEEALKAQEGSGEGK